MCKSKYLHTKDGKYSHGATIIIIFVKQKDLVFVDSESNMYILIISTCLFVDNFYKHVSLYHISTMSGRYSTFQDPCPEDLNADALSCHYPSIVYFCLPYS